MKTLLISLTRTAKRSPVVRSVWNHYRLALWKARGSNPNIPAPDLVKHDIVRTFAAAAGTPVLVETGTYFGEMVKACLSTFSSIYSIELDGHLAAAAEKRFAGLPNVLLFEGDSARLLGPIIEDISEKCLFWLDAHYSGGFTAGLSQSQPVLAELSAVLNHKRSDHVILIDDARCFDGANGYPTVDELRILLEQSHKPYLLSIRNDIIRIYSNRLSPP